MPAAWAQLSCLSWKSKLESHLILFLSGDTMVASQWTSVDMKGLAVVEGVLCVGFETVVMASRKSSPL